VTQFVGSPPVGAAARWASARAWSEQWRQRWRSAQPKTRTAVQMIVLLGAVACAYSYSLLTLVQNAGMQTPLAYISLVPAIALALAAVRSRPVRAEPEIHDRQLDYIVGIPLVAAAMAMNILLPAKLSAMFWVWRFDLLSLPLFVAGVVAILFGVRALWRQKLAIGYLVLAWPWPYSTVLLRILDASTSATLAGLRALLRVVPVAKPIQSGDGSLFSVVHQHHSFPISVVSACSGINGIVGFLLVGAAFLVVVRGPIIRKLSWLTAGMVLLWGINLARLLFIFWAGTVWGEHVAIDILHPFVGLATFSIGVVIMIAALKPLGMSIGPPLPRALGTKASATVHAGKRGSLAVPSVFLASILVVVAAIVLGVADVGLKSYDLVANAAGEPKLLAFRVAPAVPSGWKWRVTGRYDWAKPLFGDDSTWLRYTAIPGGRGGDLHSDYGVTADVIDTSDLQTFSAYGVEACYQFHGLNLRDVAQVDVGGGITGQALSFQGLTTDSWSVVYWIVPVNQGSTTRYERFVLYLLNAPGGTHVSLPKGVTITNLSGSLGNTPQDVALAANRAYLVAFAHELIQQQSRWAARGVRGETPSTVLALARPSSIGALVPLAR